MKNWFTKLLAGLLAVMMLMSSSVAFMEEMPGVQDANVEEAMPAADETVPENVSIEPADTQNIAEALGTNVSDNNIGRNISSDSERNVPDADIASEPVDDVVEEQSAVLGDEEEIDLTFEAQSEISADSPAYLYEEEGNIPIDEAHFPDAQFRAYLLRNIDNYDAAGNCVGMFSDGDGVLTPTEIEQATQIMLGSGISGITSLEGIKLLTNLSELRLNGTELKELDVSGCTTLTTLWCENTQIEKLNISGCTSLTSVTFLNNPFKYFYASGCTSLQNNPYFTGSLETIDFSGCTGIQKYSLSGSTVTSLNISGCTGLTDVNIYNNCEIGSLDISGCTSLTNLSINSSKIGTMDASGCTSLTKLEPVYAEIGSLNLSNCTGFERLSFGGRFHHLEKLNVSGCTNASSLDCSYLEMTELILDGCTKLNLIWCSDNQLTSLNLEGLTELVTLWCQNNQLTELNLSGFNHLRELDCGNNKLTKLNLTGCSLLYDYLNCSNNQLTTLNIDDCTILSELNCSYNKLKSLTLSNCQGLWKLNCAFNQLDTLDLSKNHLWILYCNGNPMEKVDITTCNEEFIPQFMNNFHQGLDLQGNAIIWCGEDYDERLLACEPSIKVIYAGSVVYPKETNPSPTSDDPAPATDPNPAPAVVAPAPAPATAPAEPITITKAPASTKAKAKKGRVTVSWKKIKKTKKTKAILGQIKSIQVQYSTDPNFATDVNTKTVSKKKTKATLSLQRKTQYYVRVRYVGSDGVSNWGAVKAVKTK